jgi:hypothetical protein
MILSTIMFLGVAALTTPQIAPLSFEAGKALPLAQGQWSYFPTGAGSMASYGSTFSLRCDRTTRTVTISRLGAEPAALTIATSSVTRTLPLGGRVLANDPVLDAIAFSRGRFLVAGGSGPVLAIPSWPEAARSIEDCRN